MRAVEEDVVADLLPVINRFDYHSYFPPVLLRTVLSMGQALLYIV